jgi:hypothetical protein
MPRLIVRVIGTQEDTQSESILATVESDQYDPDHLNVLVNTSLANALEALKSGNLDLLRSWRPQVSVVLTANDETVRPSLHLTQDTLHKLAEAGASFDFDPYV